MDIPSTLTDRLGLPHTSDPAALIAAASKIDAELEPARAAAARYLAAAAALAWAEQIVRPVAGLRGRTPHRTSSDLFTDLGLEVNSSFPVNADNYLHTATVLTAVHTGDRDALRPYVISRRVTRASINSATPVLRLDYRSDGGNSVAVAGLRDLFHHNHPDIDIDITDTGWHVEICSANTPLSDIADIVNLWVSHQALPAAP
jgi:hypothetical protein